MSTVHMQIFSGFRYGYIQNIENTQNHFYSVYSLESMIAFPIRIVKGIVLFVHVHACFYLDVWTMNSHQNDLVVFFSSSYFECESSLELFSIVDEDWFFLFGIRMPMIRYMSMPCLEYVNVKTLDSPSNRYIHTKTALNPLFVYMLLEHSIMNEFSIPILTNSEYHSSIFEWKRFSKWK